MSPTDKSPHELFMEAAAVETLAAVLQLGGSSPRTWFLEPDPVKAIIRNMARRLITENMETRHDG